MQIQTIHKSRLYLSICHIQAACLFARKCREIETQSNSTTALRHEHLSYAIAAIIMTSSFLEATINELFSDCSENILSDGQAALIEKDSMALLWTHGVPRRASFPILAKFNKALEINFKNEFSKNSDLFKDINIITDLRNELIHFEPKSSISYHESKKNKESKNDKKRFLEIEYTKRKIQLNPLIGEGNPFFPEKLLGYGCISWAIKKSIEFTDEFFNRLEIEPTYQHIKSSLL